MGTAGKLGRYTVLRRLSSGGMGEVFVARQEGLAGFEKLVVLKTLRPDLAERQHFRDMFFEEARVSALVRHPNVVSVLDVGIDRGIYYLVMEYLEGWSLRQVLDGCKDAGKTLPLPYVLLVTIDLAGGLDHIHGLRDPGGAPLKLVHRDVSPENAMITVDGLSKLVDFGIAKRHGSPIITEPGVLKGKARYLAPEQVRGGAISPATDQFAMASVLFEMCTGEPLLPGATTVEIMFALGRGAIRDARELCPDLPEELAAVLSRALAREPEDRFPSCGELAEELIHIQATRDLGATRTQWMEFLHGSLRSPSGGRHAGDGDGADATQVTTGATPTAVGSSRRARRRRDRDPVPWPMSSQADASGRYDSGPIADDALDGWDPGPVRPRGERSDEIIDEPHGEPHGETSGETSNEINLSVGRLIGRAREIMRIHSLFEGGSRLITLLGPGGVGKTSLARHHAYVQRRRASEREIYFCDLSEARSDGELAYAVAESLQIPLTQELSWNDAVVHIGDALAGHGAILLILDNLEQVIEPMATAIAHWLELAPEASFLTTSREPLDLRDEERIDIEPLARHEAVDLLCHRIRTARPGWSPSVADRTVAGQIVDQLDCLPLAIELAAARGGVLTLTQLFGRLTSGLDWLRSRRRDLAARHASLIDTIAWSWELLDPHERSTLAQCSVFRGGFSLVAAEHVIELSDDANGEVIDIVQSLREKSLLYTDTPRGAVEDELRFRMYESIRSFAASKLAEVRRDEAAARHLDYYMSKAEILAKGVNGPDGAACLDEMAASLDNFTVALETARAGDRESGGPRKVVRLVRAVERMLAVHGPAHLHSEWLDAGLDAARQLDAVSDVARLLEARGLAAMRRGDSTAGWADLREAIEIGESLGDSLLIAEACEAMCVYHLQRRELEDKVRAYQERAYDLYRQLAHREGEARILGTIALYHQRTGEHDRAREHYDQAIALHERMGSVWAAGKLYGRRGLFHFETRRLAEARSDLERSIAIVRQFGDVMREATNYLNLGCVELEPGHHEEAERCVDRAMGLYRRIGHRPSQALAHVNLAVLSIDRGELDAAEKHLGDALVLARETEYHAWEIMALGNLGILAQVRGDLDAARTHLESVHGERDRYPLSWSSLSTFLAHMAAVQAALGDLDSARMSFARCRDRIERGNHPDSLALVQCLEGFCNLTEARRAGDVEEARRHIERARRRGQKDASQNCDLRIAQRLLGQAIDEAERDLGL